MKFVGVFNIYIFMFFFFEFFIVGFFGVLFVCVILVLGVDVVVMCKMVYFIMMLVWVGWF